MSLPEGTPGSRTTYQIEITAREKEACERAFVAFTSAGPNALIVIGDNALVSDVLRKIALLPKKVSSMNCPGSPNAVEVDSDCKTTACSTILRSWKCKVCGGFHCWTKPPSPAGSSSGTTRHYEIPDHALKLIRETEDRTVSLFPNL